LLDHLADAAPALKRCGEFSSRASKHGILDMAGNVWEWTLFSGIQVFSTCFALVCDAYSRPDDFVKGTAQ
jgi:formylglycine-generating enzyme required for sulfatase activity